MQQILIFILGIMVAVAGYFLKRWWEGQSLKDKIQRFTDVLRLHNEISETNIPENVLSALRKEVFSRSRWQRRDEMEVLNKIGISLREKIETENADDPVLKTQSEMNQYAYHLADLAEREMNFQVAALDQKLDDSEQALFRKTQRAWRLFASRQVEFSSLCVAGGSMQPLMRASEFRDLAIERAAKIKNELRLRANTIVPVPEL